MDVHQNGDELEFQYKLIEGVIDNSYASYTALKNGIPKEIVDRANEIYEHLRKGENLINAPRKCSAAEQLDFALAQQMDELMGTFRDWDLENDPIGFLQIAQEALVADDEDIDNYVEDENNILDDEDGIAEDKEDSVQDGETTVQDEDDLVIVPSRFSEDNHNEESIAKKRAHVVEDVCEEEVVVKKRAIVVYDVDDDDEY